jgi:hypothetical protein
LDEKGKLVDVFGSLQAPHPYCSSTSEEVSVYTVFSFAFLFLLRLYKFYVPSQGHYASGRTGTVRPELTLDYFLLMHNTMIPKKFTTKNADCTANTNDLLRDIPRRSIHIDSFPKLRAWYFQNQACVASILSGLCNPRPIFHVADKILNMIFCKENKCDQWMLSSSSMGPDTDISSVSSTNSTTSLDGLFQSTSTSISESEDQVIPLLPAWKLLEAIPIVLESLLTACANGKLSSRQLTTGLLLCFPPSTPYLSPSLSTGNKTTEIMLYQKSIIIHKLQFPGLRDLVNFLPASIAAVVSYCSAEITRGIWKDVPMNGTDWPSPSEALYTFESGVKEFLASAGLHIQRCYARESICLLD